METFNIVSTHTIYSILKNRVLRAMLIIKNLFLSLRISGKALTRRSLIPRKGEVKTFLFVLCVIVEA